MHSSYFGLGQWLQQLGSGLPGGEWDLPEHLTWPCPSSPVGCDPGREQQSTCTSRTLIAAFPGCPRHAARCGLHILIPSHPWHNCREASGCTRESLWHKAEPGVSPQQQVWVLLAWHSLKFPRKIQELPVTVNVGRSRAGTM